MYDDTSKTYLQFIWIITYNFSCETEIDECESNPCQNGGTCLDEIGKFSCVCVDDYIGETCNELKIKNCSKAQCQNGGTCNDIYSKEILKFQMLLVLWRSKINFKKNIFNLFVHYL